MARVCEWCGNDILPAESDSQSTIRYKAKVARFCSKSCANTFTGRSKSIHEFEKLERNQVKNEDGCWGWVGCKDNHGYGMVQRPLTNYNEKAHRVSYRKYIGEIPEGMEVRHKCDNPECTNPDHLEIGTHADNMRDMKERMRRIEITKDQMNVIMSVKMNTKRYPPFDGLTLDQLAEKIGVCRATAYKYLKRFRDDY